MRKGICRSALSLLLLGVVAGCTERSSPVRRVAGELSAATVPGRDNLVFTPAGWYHRDCVYQVPNGAVVDMRGNVTLPDGSTYQIPRCSDPGPVKTAAMSPRGAGTTPTYDGWPEDAEYQPGTAWGEIDASWHVPAKPSVAYADSQRFYTFPGLGNVTNTDILQPVLQFNRSLNNNKWTIEPWRCAAQCGHGPAGDADPTDSIVGSVRDSACSSTTCTWIISVADLSKSIESTYSPQDTSYLPQGVGGAIETYGRGNCDELPDTGVFYTGIALYDQNGTQTTPNWQAQTNQNDCDFRVRTTATTVSLLYHNQPNPVVTVSGPSLDSAYSFVTMDASSTGPSPYSYAWSVNGSSACSNSSSCTAQSGAQGTWTVFSVVVTDGDTETGVGTDSVYAQWPQCPTCYGPTKGGGNGGS